MTNHVANLATDINELTEEHDAPFSHRTTTCIQLLLTVCCNITASFHIMNLLLNYNAMCDSKIFSLLFPESSLNLLNPAKSSSDLCDPSGDVKSYLSSRNAKKCRKGRMKEEGYRKNKKEGKDKREEGRRKKEEGRRMRSRMKKRGKQLG